MIHIFVFHGGDTVSSVTLNKPLVNPSPQSSFSIAILDLSLFLPSTLLSTTSFLFLDTRFFSSVSPSLVLQREMSLTLLSPPAELFVNTLTALLGRNTEQSVLKWILRGFK